MASNDPLSDPLSCLSTGSPQRSPASAPAPWTARESDLFAPPFHSSVWKDADPSEPDAEEDTQLSAQQREARDETEEPRQPVTTLDARAPSFVPAFASVEPPSPDPISIATPSDVPQMDELASTSLEEATPQASNPSPLIAREKRDPEAYPEHHKPLESTRNQGQKTEQSEATRGDHSRSTRSRTNSTETALPPPPSRSPSTASAYSPSILRNLIAQSCQSGDLPRLRLLFAQYPDSDELFTLANAINPTTGFAPLHHAAKKGHVEVAKWLIQDCGAMAGLEDADGETALHKACLGGRTEVAEYLLGVDGVEIEGTDNDGWTPLHNAASIGSLPLLSLLLSHGASLSPLSSHGYTPLMNSASKGFLPAVHLLLKRGADPLIRNQWGETAFDLAAGVFEVRCCEVLGQYERIAWSAKRDKARRQGQTAARIGDYSLLGLHSTVPVVLHENQRLVTPSLARFPTLAKAGDHKWTSKALSRNDARAAFTLPDFVREGMTDETSENEGEERACFRSEVGLPVVGSEGRLVVPAKREVRSGGRVRNAPGDVAQPQLLKKKSRSTLASTSLSSILASTSTSAVPSDPSAQPTSTAHETPAWTWISSWTIDLSSPLSSPVDGWSYSQSFASLPDEWQPCLPPEGVGNAKKWVRRRRWVRVMRRRVDLANWGYVDESVSIGGDYRFKAKFLVERIQAEDDGDESKQLLTRLERAANELRSGIETDENEERRRDARDDLEKILERIALIKVRTESTHDRDSNGDSEEEFVYSGRDAEDEDTRSIWTTTRPSSLRTPSVAYGEERSASSDFFSTTPTLATAFRQQQDLIPQLAQNPEFRVPTDEHASFFPSMSRSSSGQYSHGHHRTAWEPDEAANECRRCATSFSFFKRKHHCRRCGLVCCASCTTHKDPIDPFLVVREPGIPPTLEDLQPWALSTPLLYRTCDSCHTALALPQGLATGGASSVLSPQSFFPPSPSVGSATPSETNVSEASELTECPCCGASLGAFGARATQEAHVRKCLEDGEGSISSGRYLVFNLPPGPLVGEDCGICFEECEINDRMARLVCLCTFHETCIRAWLSRGHTCPVHEVPRE
ncbi:hypothetical protein JCM11491_001491 [Sporobolomyces phaffii]